MAMKVPVVAHLSTDGDHAEAVRMYLGEDTDDFDPPRPTDAEVHIHTDPQMTFYVRCVYNMSVYWLLYVHLCC